MYIYNLEREREYINTNTHAQFGRGFMNIPDIYIYNYNIEGFGTIT